MAVAPTPLIDPDIQRCGGCARYCTERASLAHLGFGVCVLRPEWVQQSGLARCHFTPSKWTGAAA